MPTDYGAIALLFIIALIIPLGGVITSLLLELLRIRPSHPYAVKDDTYECGVTTVGPTWIRFNFRYYYFALLFVIFDVEAVFLYPWAIRFRQLALFGFIEMLIFILILVVGYIYAWRKRALEWH